MPATETGWEAGEKLQVLVEVDSGGIKVPEGSCALEAELSTGFGLV